MPKHLKLALKIAGTAICILLLLWLGIAAYVTLNKEKLLATVVKELNNGINGTLSIEKMEPALIRGFPGISVSLKNIVLRDSLYVKHRHSMLEAREAFIALNVFSLMGGVITIEKLSINNGSIYLFTDSTGESNNAVLVRGSKSKNDNSKKVKNLELRNVSFIQENQQRKKLFNFMIHELKGEIDYHKEGWNGNINLRTKVNSLTFNQQKGSFIQNQEVKTSLELSYSDETKILTIPLQNLHIGEDDFKVGGTFRSTETLSDFKLSIIAPKLLLTSASKLLTKNIAVKLNQYRLKNPLFAEALIQGSLKKRGDPKILISWKTENNELTVAGEKVKNCSFSGYFDNEFKKGMGFNDPNSVIGFAGFKGNYYTIPFRADTIRIVNLRRPVFEGYFRSSFALSKLNKLSGSQTFRFDQGTAKLNILYRAPYNKSNSIEPYIFGAVSISNAGIAYLPRNLNMTNISGIVRFRGQSLYVQDLRARSGSSSFVMQASLLNFLNLYYTDPKKIRLDWHIKSPQIELGTFLAFLGKRKTSARAATPNRSAARVFNQLDRVLAEANAHLDVEVDKLNYRRFSAGDVHSSILLTNTGIELQDVSLNHAGGRLRIKGNINQSSTLNRFNIDTRIINVDLPKLFYAFENFGQDAIAYQNLKGTFNSTTKVSGLIRDNGQIVPRSFNGSVKFDIKEGALLNFEPMQKIGNFAFPNRDFNTIRFNQLKNTLTIKGSTITIPAMYIRSSVLNLFVEGVYGMPTGTDIALRVPLRNPKRDIGMSDSLKKERFDNGIVINLRAQDDENGNVKFKLGKKDDDEDEEKQEKAKKEREKAIKEREKALRKEERREVKSSP